MQQPLINPRDDRDAYDYSIQATEDHHEQGPAAQREKRPVWRPESKPNYKPTPLRWPFIGGVIALLLVAITLIVVAEKRMPDSDSSVTIMGIHPNATQPFMLARDVSANGSLTPPETTAEVLPPSTTPAVVDLRTTSGLPTVESKPDSSPSSEEGTVVETIPPATSESQPPSTPPVSHSEVQSPPLPPVISTLPTPPSSSVSSLPLPSVSSAIIPASNAETATPSFTASQNVDDTEVNGNYAATSASSSIPEITSPVVSSSQTVDDTGFNGRYGATDDSSNTFEIATSSIPSSEAADDMGFNGRYGAPDDTSHTSETATSSVSSSKTVDETGFNGRYGATDASSNALPIPPTSTFSLPSGAELIPISTSVSRFTTNITMPASTIIITSEVSSVVTLPFSSDITFTTIVTSSVTIVGPSTIYSSFTNNGTVGSTPVATATLTQGGVTTITSIGVTPTVGVSTLTAVGTVTSASTITGVVIPSVGEVTITYYSTSMPDGRKPIVTQPPGPVTITDVEVIGETNVVVVHSKPPVVVVVPSDGVETRVVDQRISTGVVNIGGSVVTNIVVITPSAGAPGTVVTIGGTPVTVVNSPDPVTRVTVVDGVQRTIVQTPPPQTVIRNEGGVDSTILAGQVFTQTVVNNVGGTPVVVTTANGAGFQPVSFTITTMVGGTPTVITVTPGPTTFVETSPSTSISTRARTTRTFTKTATPTKTSTSTPDPQPTVVSSTRVFRWTEADIFIGTFLPPLLCVALVIPLRIIDLNAKLYQPFVNLAQPGGGSGTDTLLLQYTGLMGFLTPVITLLQGHPVPFLTTLMIGCASFMVPLATEAIGLKLHGQCYLNTASPTCGPALGEGYGIVLMDEAGTGLRGRRGEDTESDVLDEPAVVANWGSRFSQQLPFLTLRHPWRIVFMLFQLGVLIFIIYFHAYYRGGIRDNGRLWLFMNANTFGVRFVSAIVGVVIAFCWQSFFLSVSIMTPFLLLSLKTQPATNSVLFTPSTNPFSGLYSSVRRHPNPFLFCVSLAAIMSEFLPVILSNVPFNLAQTRTAATVCAVLSCLFLGFMLVVLIWSFWVQYPPMPVDPRTVGGILWYVSKSLMLDDFEGVSKLDGKEREQSGRKALSTVVRVIGCRAETRSISPRSVKQHGMRLAHEIGPLKDSCCALLESEGGRRNMTNAVCADFCTAAGAGARPRQAKQFGTQNAG
ncbi:hypothetical protein N0V88_004235 [Collariella sp. IMI 366227]|nr:hypothetical protein N0V88_004235 [Collariella sp. IMI 366227]